MLPRNITLILLGFFAKPSASHAYECPCDISDPPDYFDKVGVARWMVHSLTYGVVSTFSSRLDGHVFGNVYSFVDGPCHNSTGSVYLYGTYMDQTFSDVKQRPQAALTLSEASLDPMCHDSLKQCSPQHYGDPESPVCARLTLTGYLVEVEDEGERDWAETALFQRHPSMTYWPKGHHWLVMRLDIEDLWFLDYFGGATILDPSEYFTYDNTHIST